MGRCGDVTPRKRSSRAVARNSREGLRNYAFGGDPPRVCVLKARPLCHVGLRCLDGSSCHAMWKGMSRLGTAAQHTRQCGRGGEACTTGRYEVSQVRELLLMRTWDGRLRHAEWREYRARSLVDGSRRGTVFHRSDRIYLDHCSAEPRGRRCCLLPCVTSAHWPNPLGTVRGDRGHGQPCPAGMTDDEVQDDCTFICEGRDSAPRATESRPLDPSIPSRSAVAPHRLNQSRPRRGVGISPTWLNRVEWLIVCAGP